MTTKTQKWVSTAIMAIPSLIMTYSGIMKITKNEMMVESLGKIGFLPYITFIGVAELVFVILFMIPKTYKVGFLFVTSYLGGAAALEIVEGRFPIAFVFIALAWIGVYVRDKNMFLTTDK